MSSSPEKDPKRPVAPRKRFEDAPAGVSSANAQAVATPPSSETGAPLHAPHSVPANHHAGSIPQHHPIPDNEESIEVLIPIEVPDDDIPWATPVSDITVRPAPSENTMSGGVVPGELTYLERAPNTSDNTMTGGALPAAQIRPNAAPDNTMTGGLGYDEAPNAAANLPFSPSVAPGSAPDRNRIMQSLTRARKFDDFVPPRPAVVGKARSGFHKAVAPIIDKSVWNVGDVIEGKYDVTAIAGQGGMGVVYKVHHREWNIDMAVKTPLPALVEDPAAKARFLREAQFWVDLGLHPNLVQCWYVRELGGLPRVFVDYLAGGSLKDWFLNGQVGPGKWNVIIDLIVQACDGLGYAHERGVVHRDIKPGNMLMSPDGRLCITDFGLVKLSGVEDVQSTASHGGVQAPVSHFAGELTRTGLSLGTPQYGAPEQWGQARHVDARADIYAMGVLLYELCCGRRPFDESGKGEPAHTIIARHISTKPQDPRFYHKDVPAPLAELALKCLAKNPAGRPQTLLDVRKELVEAYAMIYGTPLNREAPEIAESRASALNNRAVSMWDLGEPLKAEAAWKEALTLDPHHAESVYNSSLVDFRAGVISDFEVAERLREAAKTQRKALLFLGHVQLETCDATAAEKSFHEALSDPALAKDGVAWRAQGHSLLALDRFKDAEAAYAKALAVMPNDEASLAGAAQARRCDRVVSGRRAYPNITCLRTVEDRIGSVRTVAMAADGRSIFSDGSLNSVVRFELPTGHQMNNFRGQTKQVLCIAPTPDGQFIVCGGEDSILRKWSVESAVLIEDFYGKGHISSIASLAITPDSAMAATTGADKSVRLWELAKGTPVRTIWGHEDAAMAVVFSPDGKTVVSGGNDSTIRFWEMPAGTPSHVLRNNLTEVRSLVFSPDGRFLYSGGADGRILKWDCTMLNSEHEPWGQEFYGHKGMVNSLALVPGGRFLISGGDDHTVRIWDTEAGHCLRTLTGHQGAVHAVAVTPDGELAISGAAENLGSPLRLWRLELDRYTREKHQADPYAAALYVCRVESQDTSQTANREFKTHLNEALTQFESQDYNACHNALKKARKVSGYERDPRALELNAKLTSKLPAKNVAAAYLNSQIEGRHAGGFKAIAFASNGTRAFSAGRNDKSICAWDTATGAFIRTLEGHKQAVESIALTTDGKFLVSGSSDFSVIVWDALNGSIKANLQGHRGEVNAVATSRDNRLAATASSDGKLKIWELSSGRCVKTFEKEDSTEALTAVKFMPDGRSILVGGRDGSVSMWSIVISKCIREFKGHSGAILDIAIVADKALLFTASEDRTLRMWNLDNGASLWVARDGKTRFNSISLSPDGRFVFSGGLEGTNTSVKVWDAVGGSQLQTLCPHSKGVASVALSLDGCRMLTGSEDKTLRVWELEWELISTGALAALIRKPTPSGFSPSPSSPSGLASPNPSGFTPKSGFNRRDFVKPSGEFSRTPPEESKRSRPSIYIDKTKS